MKVYLNLQHFVFAFSICLSPFQQRLGSAKSFSLFSHLCASWGGDREGEPLLKQTRITLSKHFLNLF